MTKSNEDPMYCIECREEREDLNEDDVCPDCEADMNKAPETLSELLLNERDKGNAVIAAIDGLCTIPVLSLIDQPADGILYDLNRLEEVALTFLSKDRQWVNNFAVALVIRELKNQITNSQERLEKAREILINEGWDEYRLDAALDVSKENVS